MHSCRRRACALCWGPTSSGDGAGRAGHCRTLSQGAIEADAFVVSLGTGSPALARPLMNADPLKGYSITVPAGSAAQREGVTDAARKVVFARVGERLRVAGWLES